MGYVRRHIRVPAEKVELARTLCEQLAGPAGAGMFTRGLSPTGLAPATHFISFGMIDEVFARALADASIMASLCADAGIAISEADCLDLLSACSIGEDDPWAGLEAVGLTFLPFDLSPEER